MYTLRPFTASDNDYQTKVDIWNAGHADDLTTLEMQKYYDSIRNKQYLHQVDFIEHDGEPIAYGGYNQNRPMLKVKKCFVFMAIRPEYEAGQDVRKFYLDHAIQQLQDTDIHTIAMWSREDYADDLRFFEDNGFKQVMRFPLSELDVQSFDAVPFAHRAQKLVAEGIEFITAKQLKAECPDDWMEQLYQLEVAVAEDIPRSEEEYTPRTFDEYADFRLKNINFIPESYFIARENGQCVGNSILKKNMADVTKLQTALTGTLRSHRRRGIATALKVKAIQYARAMGVKTIETDNEESNPMYQINLQLGFEPKPAYLDFEKPLT